MDFCNDLRWVGKSQSDVCTIAKIWQWFEIEELEGCMPNSQTFDLLLALAMDINLLDNMSRELPYIDGMERLYLLMKQNPNLHKKIDLQAFATYMENWNETVIIYVINWILEEEIKLFNHIIKEINNQTFNYMSKEDWMESPYLNFNGVTEIIYRK